MADTSLLDRKVYGLSEAADLAGLATSTLRNWLLGYERKGRLYLPVLRNDNNADTEVSWGEFIEAVMLKTLRGDHNVTLHELRVFCHSLRTQEGEPYPLAMRDVLLNGSKLLYPLRLAEADVLIDDQGQVLTEPAIRLFVDRVRWEGDAPVSYNPDTEHPLVEVNPLVRFGAPQVYGVSTEAVYELHAAGESIDLIADTWSVEAKHIYAAIEYEDAKRGLASAA